MKEFITKVIEGKNLSESEAAEAMETIMDGEASPAQIGAFLTGLRVKGETVPEITGFARTMRSKAGGFKMAEGVVDTCGTGGDMKGTFNISTTAVFVAAAAGLKVAKHGNRSVSSQCGSADVLEKLGVKVELEPEEAEKSLEEVGITFLFAPKFHSSMKHVAGPRREIGVRTAFNLLGPLTNPASVDSQVMGVYNGKLTEPLAQVLHRLGVKRAFVVHGNDGLDEITVTDTTKITELNAGHIQTYDFDLNDVGMELGQLEELIGGGIDQNAEITMSILKGETGTRRNAVVLNAAFAILAGNRARSIEEAIEIASDCIDSGAAYKKLEELIRFTGSCAA